MRKRRSIYGLFRSPLGSSGAGLIAVPKLEELVRDPSTVSELDECSVQALKSVAISALNLLGSQELRLLRANIRANGQRPDRLLEVAEAAQKLGVTPDWLYRHHRQLAFTVRHGRLLRFSENGIEEDIRRRHD